MADLVGGRAKDAYVDGAIILQRPWLLAPEDELEGDYEEARVLAVTWEGQNAGPLAQATRKLARVPLRVPLYLLRGASE